MKNDNEKLKQGFTLVEMIVAIGLFTIVLFISSSAFLAVLNADRKSRATRIAIDNLNLALEDMSRRVKTGTTYNCGGASGTQDCATSPWGTTLAITDQGGERIIYKRGIGSSDATEGNSESGCGSGYADSQGCIVRERAGVPLVVTGPDIDITTLSFIVGGTSSADTTQPYAVILVAGKTTAGKITSDFKIQTMVTQRAYDI